MALGSLWRQLLFALRFGVLPDHAERRHRRREPHPVQPQHRRAGRGRWRRSCGSIRIRTWCSPTAGCSGSTTPTRPARAIRTRRAAADGLELHPQLGEVRHRRLRRHDDRLSGRRHATRLPPPTRGYSPACSSRWPRCRPSLREHVRYPEDIFAIQSQVYATYHMTQPAVFYNREDQWEIPAIEEGADSAAPHAAVLHDHAAAGRAAMPSSSRCCRSRRGGRDNLAAWLVARSDGEHYGKLRVFEFPKQKLVFGPRQVVARISQDQTISPQITLWNQQGSQVIWGTLMVIPIEESLIYVRPLYLRAQGGTHSRADARHRRLREPDRDGGDARRGAGPPVRRRGCRAPRPPTARSCRRPARSRHRPAAASGRASGAGHGRERWRPRRAAHYDRAIAAQRAGDWAQLRRGDPPARRSARAHAREVDSRPPGWLGLRSAVFIHARSTSATLHACAMQPRGV